MFAKGIACRRTLKLRKETETPGLENGPAVGADAVPARGRGGHEPGTLGRPGAGATRRRPSPPTATGPAACRRARRPRSAQARRSRRPQGLVQGWGLRPTTSARVVETRGPRLRVGLVLVPSAPPEAPVSPAPNPAPHPGRAQGGRVDPRGRGRRPRVGGEAVFPCSGAWARARVSVAVVGGCVCPKAFLLLS